MGRCPYPWQRVWKKSSLGSLPAQTILWLHNHHLIMEFFSECNLAFNLEPECWLKKCTCTFQRRFVVAPKLEGKVSPKMEWFLPKKLQVSNSFCALPCLWMAAVIPPGSGLAVCVPIHSSPKQGLQVHAQSAELPGSLGQASCVELGIFFSGAGKRCGLGEMH